MRHAPGFSEVSEIIEKPEQVEHFILGQAGTIHPELTEFPVHLRSMVPYDRCQLQGAAEELPLAEIRSDSSSEPPNRVAFDALFFFKDNSSLQRVLGKLDLLGQK